MAGCRLRIEDFHYDHEDSIVRLHEKGKEFRTVGLNIIVAGAIKEYMDQRWHHKRFSLDRPELTIRALADSRF